MEYFTISTEEGYWGKYTIRYYMNSMFQFSGKEKFKERKHGLLSSAKYYLKLWY